MYASIIKRTESFEELTGLEFDNKTISKLVLGSLFAAMLLTLGVGDIWHSMLLGFVISHGLN